MKTYILAPSERKMLDCSCIVVDGPVGVTFIHWCKAHLEILERGEVIHDMKIVVDYRLGVDKL